MWKKQVLTLCFIIALTLAGQARAEENTYPDFLFSINPESMPRTEIYALKGSIINFAEKNGITFFKSPKSGFHFVKKEPGQWGFSIQIPTASPIDAMEVGNAVCEKFTIFLRDNGFPVTHDEGFVAVQVFGPEKKRVSGAAYHPFIYKVAYTAQEDKIDGQWTLDEFAPVEF
ncbi:MAG: hypothetical protein FWG97_01295 [Deltaproteobacteria bacterium]|nr:hypothetical protein [Deltaproteobacteria bacterium]